MRRISSSKLMGTRLERGSVLTISGFLAVFFGSSLTSVCLRSVTVTAANVSWDPRFAPRFTVDEAAGLFGAGTTSFTLLFFLGSFGLAIMDSLHPPKFRND